MSWSRVYGPGLLLALVLQAREEAPTTKAGIPEFEHGQVDAAIDAAEVLAKSVPADCTVQLSLSGHGWRNAVDGSGSGNVCANVSYTVAATAPLQPAEAVVAKEPDEAPAPDAPAAGDAVGEGLGNE